MNRTMTLRRHLFLTTACCAGLFVGGASALAQQQAAGLVQPKGGWAVTRIDESSTQGGAYCTLARQYQNGVILSIGRNKAEEYSIAVDYQDAKLDKDKPYDVTLKAGNQTRQLQMIPVSTRAMVIRLGWDDSFFAAMEKSQNFSMTLDKTEKVELALTEYAKGKTDLAQCMETLKEGGQSAPSGNTDILNAEAGAASGFSATRTAQAAPAATTPAAAPVDETKRPEATRITQLDTPMVPRGPSEDRAAYVAPMRSSDVASLETENEKLRQQLNEQRRAYETRLSETGGQGNRIAELEEKLRLAERRGGSAPAAPAAAPAVVPVPTPVPTPVVKEVLKEVEVVKPDPAQAQKVAALESELADLRRQLAARSSAPAVGEMKAAPTPMPNPDQAKRITALQDEVEGLKKQLAAAKDAPAAPQVPRPPSPGNLAAVETLQATLADRDREINDLQSKLITQNHAVAAQDDVASLRRQLQQRENHVRSAQQHIAARDREVSQLRQQIAQLQRATQAPAARRPRPSTATPVVAPTPAPAPAPAPVVAAAPVAAVAPTPVAAVTPPPAAPVQKPALPPRAAPATQVATPAAGLGLQTALSRAGISASATSGSNGASEAWQWRNGSLAGRAEAYQGRGNATDVSQQYANTQRSACAGDFAAVPGPSQGGRIALDLACVESNGTVRTQSTLFTEQGGQVVALILEAPAEDMDRAMDARDRLGGQL